MYSLQLLTCLEHQPCNTKITCSRLVTTTARNKQCEHTDTVNPLIHELSKNCYRLLNREQTYDALCLVFQVYISPAKYKNLPLPLVFSVCDNRLSLC